MALNNEWIWALACLAIACICAGFTALLLNSFCLFAMLKNNILVKNCSFRLVALLCLADALQGLAFIIGGIIRFLSYVDIFPFMSQVTCVVVMLPALRGSAFISATMLMLAAERFFVVASPLSYHRNGETFVCVAVPIACASGLITGFSAFAGISPDVPARPCSPGPGTNLMWLTFAGNGKLAALALTCVFYIGTVFLFRARKNKIALANNNAAKSERQHARQVEVMKMALLVCTVYLVFTGLGTIGVTFFGVWFKENLLLANTLGQIANLMTILNCCFNVFIFPAKSTEMLNAVKETLKRTICSKLFENVSNAQPVTKNSSAIRSTEQSSSVGKASVATVATINVKPIGHQNNDQISLQD